MQTQTAAAQVGHPGEDGEDAERGPGARQAAGEGESGKRGQLRADFSTSVIIQPTTGRFLNICDYSANYGQISQHL